MDWLLHTFKNAFNYRGRERRKEFGYFFLLWIMVEIAIVLLSMGAGFLRLTSVMQGINYFEMAFLVVMNIVGLSLTARRLHDIGWSGWWQCAVYLGILVATASFVVIVEIKTISPSWTYWISYFIGFGLIWLFRLFLLFKSGQKQPNKYGESPKYSSQSIEQPNTDFTP